MSLNPIPHWLNSLERDPIAAIDGLLAGQVDLGQFSRLDYAEFLSRTLAKPTADPASRERIDLGIGSWLAACQANDVFQRQRLGVQSYLYRLNEALASVVLLKLPRSAYQLREMELAYRRWLKQYDFGYGDSPYAGFWRALAVTQVDRRFQSQWHDFVVRAGEAYPRYALNIGLTGLRGLNLASDQRLLLLLNALLRRAWRIGTEAAATEFAKRVRAVAAEMPMANDSWRGRVLRLLGTLEDEEQAHNHSLTRLHGFQHALSVALKPWLGDIRLGRATAQAVRVPDLPKFEERQRIAQELRENRPSAIERALNLFGRHSAYAEATGDAYFFVRTLCNLGHRLLLHPDVEARDVDSLSALLRRALVWEPTNPYPWTFWAELELAAGREDVAETVLWEAVRRFPENSPSRVELALLLQHRHEREHASILLVEAEQLLREAVECDPQGLHSRSELARLLALTGREPEAYKLLTQWLAGREHRVWQWMKECIESGQGLPQPQPRVRPGGTSGVAASRGQAAELRDLRVNATAARFAYALERGEAPDRSELAGEAELARFYRGWFGLEKPAAEEEGVRPPYALAALVALEDPSHWASVENKYPENSRDTVLLKLYAGIDLSNQERASLTSWLEPVELIDAFGAESDEANGDADGRPIIGRDRSYEDFLRNRVHALGLLGGTDRSTFSTADRIGAADRLMEKHLARTIEADISPLAFST